MLTLILPGGYEARENGHIEKIESVYIRYCKYAPHLKTSTPTCMVLGDPIILQIQIRKLRFKNK